jgi:hypothetical protein
MKAIYSKLHQTRHIQTQNRALYRADLPLDVETLPRYYHQMNLLQFLGVKIETTTLESNEMHK